MYAQEMKLPEGKQCAAFISVNLAAEFFWLSLDKRAAEMPSFILRPRSLYRARLRRPIRKKSEKSQTEAMRSPATAMNMKISVS